MLRLYESTVSGYSIFASCTNKTECDGGWGEVALTEWFGAPRRDSLAKGLSAAYIRFTER